MPTFANDPDRTTRRDTPEFHPLSEVADMQSIATLATPKNMRRWEQANQARTIETPDGPAVIEARRCVAYSSYTGEEYSAASGDYWQLADDEPLLDSEGEPMILARQVCAMVDVFTGEEL